MNFLSKSEITEKHSEILKHLDIAQHIEKPARAGKKLIDLISLDLTKVTYKTYYRVEKSAITMHLMSLSTFGNGGSSLIINTYVTKNSSFSKYLRNLLLPCLLVLFMRWMVQKINPILLIN